MFLHDLPHLGVLPLSPLLLCPTTARETAIAEQVPDGEAGGGAPEHEVEGGEGGGRARRAADRAAAVEQVVQEDGQGDEPGEVECRVDDFEGEGGPGVGDCVCCC